MFRDYRPIIDGIESGVRCPVCQGPIEGMDDPQVWGIDPQSNTLAYAIHLGCWPESGQFSLFEGKMNILRRKKNNRIRDRLKRLPHRRFEAQPKPQQHQIDLSIVGRRPERVTAPQ